MPARKSDTSRKGEVSVARFVLAEEGGAQPSQVDETPELPLQSAPQFLLQDHGEGKDAEADQGSAAEERPDSADASHLAAGEKKDRDGKDALTIEVRLCLFQPDSTPGRGTGLVSGNLS
jgi:hypothetical protein